MEKFMDESFLELDERENAIDNLEMAAYFLENIHTNMKWKWEIIAIHQALYGFLICALQGTDARQTVYDRKKDSGKAILLHVYRVPHDVIAVTFGVSVDKVKEWLSQPYLISIHEALSRMKKRECLPSWSNVVPLVVSKEEEDSIERLTNEFRNEFEHFVPKAWLIDTLGMPNIIRHVVRVIHFVALESNCVTYSKEQENRTRIVLDKISELLS